MAWSGRRRFEVDLDILLSRAELDEIAVLSGLFPSVTRPNLADDLGCISPGRDGLV